MENFRRVTNYSTGNLGCPLCQCNCVMRIRRSLIAKWFSSHKHYICRACHTRFRNDGLVLVAKYHPVNLVL